MGADSSHPYYWLPQSSSPSCIAVKLLWCFVFLWALMLWSMIIVCMYHKVLVNTTFNDFQTVYEGEFWCLCTVTFCQKSSKLNSRSVHCSWLCGTDYVLCHIYTIVMILGHFIFREEKFPFFYSVFILFRSSGISGNQFVVAITTRIASAVINT